MTSLIEAAPSDFQQRVHKALKCWHDRHPKEGMLDDMLIAQRTTGDKSPAQRLVTNLLLKQGIGQLAVLSPADAELLDLRFCACQHVRETRQYMHYAESTIYYKQNRAIARLAAILYRLEATAWQERAACLEGRLDTPPGLLVGVEAQVTRLAALLAKTSGPWLVSIEGMGGIGKTTLAAAVLRHLAKTTVYDGFGWVSAQVSALDLCGELRPRPHPANTSTAVLAALVAQLLPEDHPFLSDTSEVLKTLRLYLQRHPHLIVIDNWETVADPHLLLPLLHSLARPSKFILTSRRRLIAEPNVRLHCVPELSRADSLLLLRQMAQVHNVAPALACDDEELAPIYAAVGGNPLALMLALCQVHVRPLQAVAADLARIHTAPLETLFDFILHQTWVDLGQRERRVLKAMLLAESGCLDVEAIRSLCGFSSAEAVASLQQLIRAGLVCTASDAKGCRYLLYNLTRTFLQWSAL